MLKKILIIMLIPIVLMVLACERASDKEMSKNGVQSAGSQFTKSIMDERVYLNEIDSMRAQISRLEAQIAEQDTNLKEFQASLAAKDATIQNLTGDLLSSKKTVKVLSVLFVISLLLIIGLIWCKISGMKRCKNQVKDHMPATSNTAMKETPKADMTKTNDNIKNQTSASAQKPATTKSAPAKKPAPKKPAPEKPTEK